MSFKKIEFWITTIAALVFMVVLTYNFFEYDFNEYYWQYNVKPGARFIFIRLGSKLLLVLFVYALFQFLNHYVFDTLFDKKKYDLMLLAFTATVILIYVVFYCINFIYPRMLDHYNYLPIITISISMFIAYIALKKLTVYLKMKSDYITDHPVRFRIAKESLFGLLIWITGLLIVSINEHRPGFTFITYVWVLWMPCAFLLSMLNIYKLLPDYDKSKNNITSYAIKLFFISAILSLFFSVFYSSHFSNVFLYWFSLVAITTPISWYIYQNSKQGSQQLVSLKTELGRTTADLQFLRSQINPHFLFNALNTLYGTALQENNERTAAGIQKLGDMMRFMLHENMQDTIALQKEAEYMQNYIDLQMLRIQSSDNIEIKTDLNTTGCNHQIAPMLLIPFIENAFKHGISLQHTSWVRVSLNCDDSNLYFDVYNSLHSRLDRDPEKDHTGIGLENVKQRLALVYPDKYELNIRKTAKEFIIHLTIKFAPVREPAIILEEAKA